MAEAAAYMPRLYERYRESAVPELTQRFGYTNPNQVPRLHKVTLNVGLGEALTNARLLEAAAEELGRISGQRAVITKSRKAIANFRLRENQSIGCMVTLRRNRMYEFLSRGGCWRGLPLILSRLANHPAEGFRGVSGSNIR